MLFVQSLRGLSHTKLEDTKQEHLELAVQALDRLADRAIHWVGGRLGPTRTGSRSRARFRTAKTTVVATTSTSPTATAMSAYVEGDAPGDERIRHAGEGRNQSASDVRLATVPPTAIPPATAIGSEPTTTIAAAHTAVAPAPAST